MRNAICIAALCASIGSAETPYSQGPLLAHYVTCSSYAEHYQSINRLPSVLDSSDGRVFVKQYEPSLAGSPSVFVAKLLQYPLGGSGKISRYFKRFSLVGKMHATSVDKGVTIGIERKISD
jgi:hypothetical protein